MSGQRKNSAYTESLNTGELEFAAGRSFMIVVPEQRMRHKCLTGDRRAQQNHAGNRGVVSTTRWPAGCFGWQEVAHDAGVLCWHVTGSLTGSWCEDVIIGSTYGRLPGSRRVHRDAGSPADASP